MGITDFFSDLLSSVSFVQDVHAEAPADDDESKEGGDDEAKDEDGGEDGGDDKEEGGDEEGGDEEEGGDDDEEEEEEEEEEPVDPKPQLEEDCAKSAQCSGYKHHYDECVERVTSHEENPDHKGPKEDCVEEYFHLQHCATQCAAVKLFKQLK
ncbi:Cytochrome b-c1 complex subunit 6, mitochondrial [Exophiala xenobiotica]|uniref:Cytochrome b-c1 complex subunit 6, mitochondrial n=1 Tax=Vermiconidia calcicola TaxID=1690605 RepID=A0AAV9Q245_9PEZI|nr:ubiquinol--cytochrome-c reductase subunit 6 [Exophiala xenobiotica]KAK5531533.1 Cytochrome b-c1 complex subunit 6, mitochondrial [Vermiconidia calcicola]KAK5544680.1 Cytochrome b-c1 complex subunit 6, mitochondrial [Chaetothyriales sp. CCFEE 6169]KAK5191334.1 Cytochrome b-c1 complex subunit 6, mitochondrial [Exophiala xenobiotica]KAK5207017.1 Cytochrome b-c1 complex subunit 6, mitochondrial [Exophiala xenobiotica]